MEIWKPLKNFPSYNCSSEGRIMNIRTQRILKTYTDEHGVEKVTLRKNNKQYTVKVARLVAETYLGEQPGLEVRHKDGTKNCTDNLYWSTRREFIKMQFDSGARYSPRQIGVKVIETGESYNSYRACARSIGISQNEISQYFAGKRSNIKGYHFEHT